MKGILLAGGAGTRLYPTTQSISKQLIPIFNKPMVYYSLSVILMAGIKDILIISTERDLPLYKALFKDGSQLGLNITYKAQENPKGGIAEAFIVGEEFIGSDKVCLMLGDNVFYGGDFDKMVKEASKIEMGAEIFAYYVKDPKRYGVIEFDDNFNVISIEEKPEHPKSMYAQTGLYFYDNSVVEIAKHMQRSERGELEITDLNKEYLKRGQLKVRTLDRGVAWLDTGTADSLLETSNFVETIQHRQGIEIGCIEEIAYQNGFITLAQLEKLTNDLSKTEYGEYLINFVEREKKKNIIIKPSPKFIKTEIPDVIIFEPAVFNDERGYFMETYNEKLFADNGINNKFLQDNESKSTKGVLRGLHYQMEPYAQAKLVRVTRGKVLDVAVDIRKGSPTFGKYVSVELSAENKRQLFIPKGFAHGFIVLSDEAEFVYKCDNLYNKESESGLIYNDPFVNIDWKMPIDNLIISEKDKLWPTLDNIKNNFVY